MAKRVAVLAVNPVNGLGLFQYLENFYENQIIYRVYAVAETTDMRTNSGIRFYADDVIENLKGYAHEYDALVFSCGDAVPVFKEHVSEAHNVALMQVIKEFAEESKLIIGHCAAALIFEIAGITYDWQFIRWQNLLYAKELLRIQLMKLTGISLLHKMNIHFHH